MLRLLTGLTALFFALAGPASAARAAPASAGFKLTVTPVTIAPGPNGQSSTNLDGYLTRADLHPLDLAYTVDFTEVAAFARLEFEQIPWAIVTTGIQTGPSEPSGPCRTKGTVITCRQPGVRATAGLVLPLASFQVQPTTAATPGDEGRIHVTARVNAGPPIVADALIRVGEPVNLAGAGRQRVSAAPGTPAQAAPQVRNAGRTPITGAALYLPLTSALYAGSFRNCVVGTALACTFDTVLEPGRTYRVSPPIPLRPPRNAAAGSESQSGGQWLTTSTFEDWQASFADFGHGERGTGPALTLVPVPGAASVPQVDVQPKDDYADLTVTVAGRLRPDLAAIGTTLTAAKGDTLTIRVGARNLGPGTLLPGVFANNDLFVDVTLPKGLAVRHLDKHCVLLWERNYLCKPSATTIRPGQSELFAFTVQVTGRTSGGRVAVNTENWQRDPVEGGRDPGNDTAKLTVNRPGGGSGLPDTGPEVALGVVLVALGGIAIGLARRRP